MSDTPRTDARASRDGPYWDPRKDCTVVPSDFARELERENAALRADKVTMRHHQEMAHTQHVAAWDLVRKLEAENAALRAELKMAQGNLSVANNALRELQCEASALRKQRDMDSARFAEMQKAGHRLEVENTILRNRSEILGRIQDLHGCSEDMVLHWCERSAANSGMQIDPVVAQAHIDLRDENAKSPE